MSDSEICNLKSEIHPAPLDEEPDDYIPHAPAEPRLLGGDPVACRCGHMRDRLWLSPHLPAAERAARRAQHTATLSSICPVCRANGKLKTENSQLSVSNSQLSASEGATHASP